METVKLILLVLIACGALYASYRELTEPKGDRLLGCFAGYLGFMLMFVLGI